MGNFMSGLFGSGGAFGPLVGGLSSILGGMMNTSSAQAINSANLQWAQENSPVANPQYLNNLVANAKTAGLNPLAVLGIGGGPGFQAQMTDPGSGLMAAGKQLAGIPDPYEEQMRMARLDSINIENANARLRGNQTAIDIARGSMLNGAIENYLRTHPQAVPEGVSAPGLPDLGADTLNTLNQSISSFGSRFGDWSKSMLTAPAGFRFR